MSRSLAAGFAFALVSAFAVPGPARAAAFGEQAKLTASDAAALDSFGGSVAISGDTAVAGALFDDHVGTDAGSAYVFTRSGTTWTQQAKLTASDAAAFDNFGVSVAVSGDTAVVGAHRDNHVATDAGSAYVFTRSGTSWNQQATLTASDAAAFDLFGESVAVSGDTAVVGANRDDHVAIDAGSAYVFTRSGASWTQQAKLTASDAQLADIFGISVAVLGDTAVVGAMFDDHVGSSEAGSAYVFTRSGTSWTQQTKLIASDAASGDNFGRSVAVSSGDTAVVGAHRDDHVGSDAGSAYVFTRSGTSWTQQAKLTASDAAPFDNFGWSVAVSGDTAVVGAHLDDHVGTDAGSAYVFANNPPVADDQVVTTDEDTPVDITLTGSDPDGDPLSFAIISNPANGTLSGAAPNLTYSPDANFNGSDAFDFSVNDGQGGSDSATVEITVDPVNDPPVADAQSVTTDEDVPVDITLTGSDIENDQLEFAVAVPPAHGTLTGTAPNLRYLGNQDYFGPDEFTFQVDDGNGGIDTAVVSITVNPVPLIDTTLEADPAIANLIPGAAIFLTDLRATLTRADGGSPLAGFEIIFSAGGTEVCRATTDSSGVATCGGMQGVAAATLAMGYEADFPEGPDHAASSTDGAVLIVNGLEIL